MNRSTFYTIHFSLHIPHSTFSTSTHTMTSPSSTMTHLFATFQNTQIRTSQNVLMFVPIQSKSAKGRNLDQRGVSHAFRTSYGQINQRCLDQRHASEIRNCKPPNAAQSDKTRYNQTWNSTTDHTHKHTKTNSDLAEVRSSTTTAPETTNKVRHNPRSHVSPQRIHSRPYNNKHCSNTHILPP